MKKFVQFNVNCNHQQMLKLKLLDESTNVMYSIEVGKEDYNRAHKDNDFANVLLEKAKALRSNYKNSTPSNCSTSPVVPSTVDNNKPSCSKSSVQYENTSDIENYNEDNYNQAEREELNIDSNEGRWTHEATLLLISLYKKNAYMLEKVPQKKMWTQICQRIKHEQKYNFTVNQCYNKMDTLKRRYRQIIDHNAQSGNDRKQWIYLEPLDEIFRDKPWVKLLSVAGSHTRDPEKSLFDDNEQEPST
ncbi:uncharacterized protein LOC112459321, partial [Temnothorax curvispinosus]|uniref:Uncharacterized protein LOC112459321 n=1 Tax=Temnothorax curvispinosus TaxID=300111 RepID=A0A6J1QCR4_9HYME